MPMSEMSLGRKMYENNRNFWKIEFLFGKNVYVPENIVAFSQKIEYLKTKILKCVFLRYFCLEDTSKIQIWVLLCTDTVNVFEKKIAICSDINPKLFWGTFRKKYNFPYILHAK